MLTIRAATRSTHEYFRPLRGNRKSCCCNCGRCDQDRMSKDAGRKNCITSDRDGETYCPHQPQYLQNKMTDGDIGDVATWADIMVEHETP